MQMFVAYVWQEGAIECWPVDADSDEAPYSGHGTQGAVLYGTSFDTTRDGAISAARKALNEITNQQEDKRGV